MLQIPLTSWPLNLKAIHIIINPKMILRPRKAL